MGFQLRARPPTSVGTVGSDSSQLSAKPVTIHSLLAETRNALPRTDHHNWGRVMDCLVQCTLMGALLLDAQAESACTDDGVGLGSCVRQRAIFE